MGEGVVQDCWEHGGLVWVEDILRARQGPVAHEVMPDVDYVQGAAGEGMPDAFSDASVGPPGRPWEAMAGLGAWVDT
eukprot:3367724-Alexandrium_andersonii.AAC.1